MSIKGDDMTDEISKKDKTVVHVDKDPIPETESTNKEKKIPLSTQRRIEKVEEEKMYASQGDEALKEYYSNMEQITKAAKDEFNLEFHSYLSLARRRQALEDLRRQEEVKKRKRVATYPPSAEEKSRVDKALETFRHPEHHKDPATPALPSKPFPTEKEMQKMIDERVKKVRDEQKKFEKKLQERDREIERLQRRLEEKSPKQKAFERRLHRKAKRSHGFNVINTTFRFPFFQKIAHKLYEADRSISEFLLDVGKAEFVITKENIVSTAARRLMNIRAVDEPEIVIDQDGNKVSRWVQILDMIDNPKKYNSNG